MLATWGCTTFPKPTLSLDFLGATSLDSGITFSRGSQATLFDSTGTLVYAKHNLVTRSQEFNEAAWTKIATTVTQDATTAPDGTLTADAEFETATTDRHLVEFGTSFAYTANQQIIFSAFVKANGRSACTLTIGASGGNFSSVFFNLATGTVAFVKTENGTATGSISDVGNGWFRIVGTFSQANNRTQLFLGICCSDRVTDTGSYAFNIFPSYAGDATKGIYVWGAQFNIANMEGGVTSSLTTYYPTTTAAYYAPRFDYNPSTLQPRGLLIEEQRTNSIRNNTMQGAVAGTPGTLPTNWAEVGGGLGTLTRQIVGTGTENGITYIDLKFSGTTSTVSVGYAFEAIGGIAASNGQTWTNSFWCKLVAGSAANITSVNSLIEERTGAGGFLANTVSAISPTATLTRFPQTFTLNAGATVGQVRGGFILVFSSGVAIDITLRIGLPQLEQGAFATSVIPTTTTALTRNADVASMTGTNFSSWYNASEGTIYASALPRSTAATLPRFYEFNGATTSISIRTLGLGGSIAFEVQDTTTQASFATGTWSSTAFMRVAGAYKVNDFAGSQDGGAVVTDNSGVIPTVTAFYIGNRSDGARNLNGWIARLTYYPKRLPDATLVALTA